MELARPFDNALRTFELHDDPMQNTQINEMVFQQNRAALLCRINVEIPYAIIVNANHVQIHGTTFRVHHGYALYQYHNLA